MQKRRIPLEPTRKLRIRRTELQLVLLDNRSLVLELNSHSLELRIHSLAQELHKLELELDSTLVLELGSMLVLEHSKLERHRTCWPLWLES